MNNLMKKNELINFILCRRPSAPLFDGPIVTRTEKNPRDRRLITVNWHFQPPLYYKDAVESFSVEFCHIITTNRDCNKWHVGATVNKTERSSVINVLPGSEDVEAKNSIGETKYIIFRIVSKFKSPHFSSTSGFLAGNATIQPLTIEPFHSPSDVKAKPVTSNEVAVVWTDPKQIYDLVGLILYSAVLKRTSGGKGDRVTAIK